MANLPLKISLFLIFYLLPQIALAQDTLRKQQDQIPVLFDSLPTKSGKITMMTNLDQQTETIYYWDNFGRFQSAEVSNKIIMGKDVFWKMIKRDSILFIYEVGKKKGEVYPSNANLIGNQVPNFSKMTLEEQKEFHFQNIEGCTLLGKECNGIFFSKDGMKTKAWLWKNIPLLVEILTKDSIKFKYEVTSIETDIQIAAYIFQIPSSVTFSPEPSVRKLQDR